MHAQLLQTNICLTESAIFYGVRHSEKEHRGREKKKSGLNLIDFSPLSEVTFQLDFAMSLQIYMCVHIPRPKQQSE